MSAARGRSSAGAGMRVFSERARTFLLLFRFDFTENRMARWRTYSELVINPWKPPTRGLLEESPTLWFFIYFLHCLILKIVWGYCSQKDRHCHATHTWYYARRLNLMQRRLWPTVLCLYDVLPRISQRSAASEVTMKHNIILRPQLKQSPYFKSILSLSIIQRNCPDIEIWTKLWRYSLWHRWTIIHNLFETHCCS